MMAGRALAGRFLSVLLLWVTGGLLIGAAAAPANVQNLLLRFYESPRLKGGVGAAGLLCVIGGVFLLRATLSRRQRERTIAFHNPDGDVTVALEAIENFVRQLGSEQEGIQELKVRTTAERGAILIEIFASLWSNRQIPEVTEHLQTILRAHVHDILGVEEPITVRVHVGKVVPPPKTAGALGESEKTFISS